MRQAGPQVCCTPWVKMMVMLAHGVLVQQLPGRVGLKKVKKIRDELRGDGIFFESPKISISVFVNFDF